MYVEGKMKKEINLCSIKHKLKAVQELNKERATMGDKLNNYYLRKSSVDNHGRIDLQLDYNVELLQLKYDCYDQLLQEFLDKLLFLSSKDCKLINIYINKPMFTNMNELFEKAGVSKTTFYRLFEEACMNLCQEISIDDFPDIEKANQEYFKLKPKNIKNNF